MKLVKVDQAGNTLINSSYGSPWNDAGYGLIQMPDSGYVLVGVYAVSSSQSDMGMIRTDSNGDSLWSYILGDGTIDYGLTIEHTPDFGYAVAGQTGSWGPPDDNGWLIKFEPEPLSGPISGVIPPGEHHIIGDISVQSGDSLIIEPGAVLLFDGDYSFDINGYLYAVGTETDSINFIPNTGIASWGGIDFNGVADDSSRLMYCFITGSNSSGIECDYSSPAIAYCIISGNSNTFNIYFGTGAGGGISCSYSSPTIENCIFIDNSANNFGLGGGIFCWGSNPVISHCTISGNMASGWGGGIFCVESSPAISHCTISENTAFEGGGINCYGFSPTVVNNIIWANSAATGSQIYIGSGSFSCTYSDIQGGWPGTGNIDEDPLFYSTTGDSAFRLTATSPCIDAGDPASPLDPDGTVADMGAYYFDQLGQALYPNSMEITGEVSLVLDSVLVDGGNLAALDSNATDGYDSDFDVPEPPPPPDDYLSIYFPHPEWSVPIADNFMHDVRNGNDDLMDTVKVYLFEVDTDWEGETVDLTFTIGNGYPAEYGAVLYDHEADVFQNLRENNEYNFTAGADIRSFDLRLGDGTAPVINITFPTAGAVLNVATGYDLTWEYTDASPIRYSLVFYSLDGGANWTLIDSISGGAMSYTWTTPGIASDSAKIKVEAEDWAGNYGIQESGTFVISPGIPPEIEIHFPTADTLLFYNTPYDLSWTTTSGIAVDYTLLYYSLDNGLNWTLIDTVFGEIDDTYTWTTPDSFSAYSKLKVSATDLAGFTGVAVTEYTFNIAPNYLEAEFAQGWHLFSIPLMLEYSAIDSIFGDDITGPFFVYSYSHLGGYSLVDTLEHGYGYWLALMEAASVDIDGMPEVDSTYTDLLESWNIVGSAIPTQVPKDSLCFTDGISIVSFSDAVDSGWVMPAFYEYDNFIGDYILTDTLAPWGGYWLNVLSDNIWMISYPPYPAILDLIASGEGERQDENALNWLAPVILHQGELANVIAGFGMHSEAADGFDIWHDVHLPPTPPSGNYIRVVYDHPEWNAPGGDRFVRDIRAIFDGSSDTPLVKEWVFLIEASDPGEITVNFQNIGKHLPEGYSAVAAYETTVLDLMETHTFSFEYAEPLEVTVKVFNQAATILGWNTDELNGSLPAEYCLESVYPNPFNPAATIRIGLPEASEVKITVYNIIGREVWKYDSGVMNAGYHNITFNAGNLSSGIYFVWAVVPGKLSYMRKIVLVK